MVDGGEHGPEYVKEGETEPIESSQADPFGDESHAQVKYRTLSWWYVKSIDHTS